MLASKRVNRAMFKIKGEIKVIGDAVQVTEKFKKRAFVLIDDSSQYPKFINFQLAQDKCELIEGFQVGQRIEVNFNLRGKEWTDKNGDVKYFNTLDVWRIVSEDSGLETPSIPDLPDEEGDGLPF
jgi:hypothetical protein